MAVCSGDQVAVGSSTADSAALLRRNRVRVRTPSAAVGGHHLWTTSTRMRLPDARVGAAVADSDAVLRTFSAHSFRRVTPARLRHSAGFVDGLALVPVLVLYIVIGTAFANHVNALRIDAARPPINAASSCT